MHNTLRILLLVLIGGCIVHCLMPHQHHQRAVPIPANADINFNNINALDGTYHFGYDTGLKYQSFREEIRDVSGRVVGKFGFIDPQGILRITEYVADQRGYRARQTMHYLVKKEKPLPIIGPIPNYNT